MKIYSTRKIIFLLGVALGKCDFQPGNKSSFFPHLQYMYKVLYIGIWNIFKIYCFCFCQNTSKNNKRNYAFKRFLVIFMVGNWVRIIVACILQQYIAHKNSNFNSITENIDVVLYFTPAITKHCVNVEYIFNDYKNKCTCQLLFLIYFAW